MHSAPSPDASALLPIRFREVAGRVVVTNPWGDWAALSREEFDVLRRDEAALRARLPRNFFRDTLDVAGVVARTRRKLRFLQAGPNLHILVVTLRCNQSCVYCHASRAPLDRPGFDMTPETARRAVDLALASTSPAITLEFQGGEPLVNYPVVREVVEYALARNAEARKALDFTLVSNLSLMDDEKLDWLVERRVQICTSVDGPRPLHDRQRRLAGGSAHDLAAGWIRRINERYAAAGLDPDLYRVEALLTTTRESLAYPREIVDTYAELGCRAIYLRPVDPFGFAAHAEGRVGYRGDAFLDFYRATVRRQAEGLTPEQLATPLAPAIMTLGGMLKHLALVEESWFLRYLEGQELSEPWVGVDWDTDPDWEWHSAAADPPEELFALYDRAIAVANDCTDRALAKAGLDTPSVRPSRREGVPFTLRWILVHLIEEYARHAGHADLIRESIDGQVDL
jgi:MoaA/NifB/PqqE/SkfB family radical SAM enzyme